MKIMIIGGAGAMGGLFGGGLALAGNDVTLVDVAREAVTAINRDGLRITNPAGATRTVRLKATADPAASLPADLILVQVKGQHTTEAMRAALSAIGEQTTVMTLQNGWGNTERLAQVVGPERVTAGITLHSVTLQGPGMIHHSATGATIVGELDGKPSDRIRRIRDTFQAAGFETSVSGDIRHTIWSKLALNVCALPVCALLRVNSGHLIRDDNLIELMQGLLREVVDVARAQEIALDFNECWQTITETLERCGHVRASMLQDVEHRRPTEIDTINGAVVEAGQRLGIPTPYSKTMVWLIKALQGTWVQEGNNS